MLLWLYSCGTQVGPIHYSLQFTATSSSALEVGIIVFCPCGPIGFCFLISEALTASWLCLPTHCLPYLEKERVYKKFTPVNFSFFHKMEKIDLIKMKQVRLGRQLTEWRTGRKNMGCVQLLSPIGKTRQRDHQPVIRVSRRARLVKLASWVQWEILPH